MIVNSLRKLQASDMPNSGMLDHRAYKSESHRSAYVYWMGAWPSKAGYQTARSLRFSRHLLRQSYKAQPHVLTGGASRPSSSRQGNTLSPFHTDMKPTCGYLFSRETDNRKRRIGISPSNLVAWRSLISYAPSPRARTA